MSTKGFNLLIQMAIHEEYMRQLKSGRVTCPVCHAKVGQNCLNSKDEIISSHKSRIKKSEKL